MSNAKTLKDYESVFKQAREEFIDIIIISDQEQKYIIISLGLTEVYRSSGDGFIASAVMFLSGMIIAKRHLNKNKTLNIVGLN